MANPNARNRNFKLRKRDPARTAPFKQAKAKGKKKEKKNKMKKFIKKKVLKIRSGLRFGDAEISRFT